MFHEEEFDYKMKYKFNLDFSNRRECNLGEGHYCDKRTLFWLNPFSSNQTTSRQRFNAVTDTVKYWTFYLFFFVKVIA